MWVDYKPVGDRYRSIYMMLIHESHGLLAQLVEHCTGIVRSGFE